MVKEIKLYIPEIKERFKHFKERVLPWVIVSLIAGFFIGRGNIQLTLSIGEAATQYAPPVVDSTSRASFAPGFTIEADAGLLAADPVEVRPFGFSDFQPSNKDEILAAEYIRRFAPLAQSEVKFSGQPASVKLAQALLESGKGQSWLAVNANAHFGRKCFEKNCKPGHCVNRTDDSHKDFFRAYGSAWESFRDHSILISGKNYAPCKRERSPEGWCKCLKKQGYATSKNYAVDLIKLIDRYGLREFDQ